MRTNFYLAGTKTAIPAIRKLTAILSARGFIPVLDWTLWYENPGLLGREEIARREINAVAEADIFIGILPCRFGLFTEMGVALATTTRRIVLYAPDEKWWDEAEDGKPTSIFVYHPKVERIIGDDPVETISRWAA
jgi:hypothetical protein